MTAPTSPGAVPADDVRELAYRIVLHCQHTAVPEGTEIVRKLLMADRTKPEAIQEMKHAEEAGAGASDDRPDGGAHVS